mgnify:CR=1 FL=1
MLVRFDLYSELILRSSVTQLSQGLCVPVEKYCFVQARDWKLLSILAKKTLCSSTRINKKILKCISCDERLLRGLNKKKGLTWWRSIWDRSFINVHDIAKALFFGIHFHCLKRQGGSGFQLGVVLGEKRPAKNKELESSQMLSLPFFRIATQPAKPLEEAAFNIETNQGFFKEQEVQWLTRPQQLLNWLVWSVTTTV